MSENEKKTHPLLDLPPRNNFNFSFSKLTVICFRIKKK